MNPNRRLISLFSFVLLGVAAALPARAASAHTFVSALGNDSNAGTAASPYLTFATAIANTTAGGMVSVLDSGDFGPATIAQSITIEGMPGATATFPNDGEGFYVNTGAGQTVIIRNLGIDGGGTGTDAIFFAQTNTSGANSSLIVENCQIANFVSIGVGTGDEAPSTLIVRNTSIDGGQLGVRTFQNGTTFPVTPFVHVHLYNVHISNASEAGVFNRNGTLDMRFCEVTDCLVGIENDTYAILSADSCVFSNDSTVSNCFTNSVQRLSNNDLWDSTTGISPAGGTVYSDGTNKKGGLVSGSIPPNATMGRY